MKRNNLKIAGRLVGLVSPMLPVMLLAVFVGVAGFLSAIAIPVLGGYGVLYAMEHSPLTTVVYAVLTCAALRGVLRYVEQYSNHYIAFKLLALIRDQVFRALRRLAPAKLEGRDKGNLISVITADIELLEVFYAHTISPVAIALIVSVLMVVFIGQYHIVLAGIAALGYIMVGVILPLITAKLGGNISAEYRTEFGKLNGFALDSLRGLREILQFGAGKKRQEEMNARTVSLTGKAEKLKSFEGMTSALTAGIILIFSLAMLFTAAILYQKHQVNFEGLFIATIAMISSFGPVTALASLSNNLLHTFAAGNRVLDILDESPVVAEVTDGKNVTFESAACEDISFGYDTERILSDFSIDFPRNQIIGVNGKSGSGKSTLLRLLMRFWDADAGSVRISGEDIRQIDTKNLRELESFVTQETQLFHDTIENNVRIANLNATHTQIVDACKKASVHDFISTLPQGYDTDVGELGDSLSGGERQRIGLARAFVHDAAFILLDEPTSNLDSLNEAVILKSLREQSAGKTVAIVSHRKSTMGIADRVYKIENGRLS